MQYQKYLQCFCPNRTQVIVSKILFLPNIELSCFKRRLLPPLLSLSQPSMSNKILYQLRGLLFPCICYLGGEGKIYFHEKSLLDHDKMESSKTELYLHFHVQAEMCRDRFWCLSCSDNEPKENTASQAPPVPFESCPLL